MMESLAVLDFLCIVAALVLAVVFVIQWIRKKPKKWVGISALICTAVVVVCTITASSLLQESTAGDMVVAEAEQTEESTEETEPGFDEEAWSEGMEAVAEMFYFHSMAELISDDVTLDKVSDDLMQITVNLGKSDPEKIREKIEKVGPEIGKAFSQDEKITSCTSCKIIVVDGKGTELFTYSIDEEANVTVIE